MMQLSPFRLLEWQSSKGGRDKGWFCNRYLFYPGSLRRLGFGVTHSPRSIGLCSCSAVFKQAVSATEQTGSLDTPPRSPGPHVATWIMPERYKLFEDHKLLCKLSIFGSVDVICSDLLQLFTAWTNLPEHVALHSHQDYSHTQTFPYCHFLQHISSETIKGPSTISRFTLKPFAFQVCISCYSRTNKLTVIRFH